MSKTVVISCLIGLILAFVAGMFTYKGCTKPIETTVSDTIRLAPDIVTIPIEKWFTRTVRVTETRVDTLREEYPDQPESGGIGYSDTLLTRKAHVLHQGGETEIEFSESIGIECDRYNNTHTILFAGTPIIYADTNFCNAIQPEAGHGFWTDVLYWLGGAAVGLLLVTVLQLTR